ncbi:MAG: hypothetical protein E6G70_05105 [Alphaproteobacteria bacterium]|nr:MAG: hypothetical protein E6G70_05105 [Alphaproteobacteria bacterium]
MAISISNVIVNSSAPPGTVIGVLTSWDASGNVVPCTYTLTKGSAGYFAVSGSKLVTAWSAPAVPGYYSVRIQAIGTTTRFSGSARLPTMW